MVWKLDAKGQMSEVYCDVCGEKANIIIRIGNENVAEACDEHAAEIRQKVRDMLKTRPGPPDRCAATSSEQKLMPRCKLDDGHEGDHQY